MVTDVSTVSVAVMPRFKCFRQVRLFLCLLFFLKCYRQVYLIFISDWSDISHGWATLYKNIYIFHCVCVNANNGHFQQHTNQYKIILLLRTPWLVSYRVYIRLCKHGCDITAPIEVRVCSWREWEALIGLRTKKENLPFDIENKDRYSQLLLLCSLLISQKK